MKVTVSRFLALAGLLALARPAPAQETPMFPFVLPWDDASPGVANVSAWNEKPAGAHGFVTVENGHLTTGNQRLRLFGTNLTFSSCFPRHADAEKTAARMAKFGINAVRFHHMDTSPTPNGLLQADGRTLDPTQLDHLDYLIAQLKRNGIYADLNLHVGLEYPGMPKWEGMPGYFKGVDLFYPPMIALQKEYARKLLTHVNPYTKTAYASEPAVAIVEVNNEDGLIQQWWGGALDDMPDPYMAEFSRQWNAWLSRRYRDDAALRAAWDVREDAPGPEMLRNRDFSSGADGWMLEQHEGAEAASQATHDGPAGAPALRVDVRRAGNSGWHVQLAQPGLRLEAGRVYTLTVRAKADPPRRITLNVSQAHDPWRVFRSQPVRFTNAWQTFSVVVRPGETDDNGRIAFSDLGTQTGAVWFADASFRPGGMAGLSPGETLGSIRPFSRAAYDSMGEAARKDWMTFLWEAESAYWTGMRDFLKDDLKVRCPVVGTACGFSPPPIQAKLDVVDGHAYWQHPDFPRRPWDAEDWTVNNRPMAGVPDGGTLPGLALARVAGKPFIVTEYNHPAPNTYSSEAFLLLAATAALQDWDGVFSFDYGNGPEEAGRIPGFFAIGQHPAKMATLPAAAALFRRADVTPPAARSIRPVTPSMALTQMTRSGSWFDASAFGVPRLSSLQRPVGMDLRPMDLRPPFSPPQPPGKPIRSDNGELTWDTANGGRVVVDTPRSKAVIGTKAGVPVELGGVRITAGSTLQNWAAVTATVMQGKDFRSPGRFLITATGETGNTDMRWKDATRTSVGREWGKAPSLVEGIPVRVRLPVASKRVRAWALDGTGRRARPISGQSDGNGTLLALSPADRTLWYEVEVR